MNTHSPEPEYLAGGNSNRVQRIGNSVRRPSGPWTPTVHSLLRSLRHAGIQVPEPLGLDDEGREVLSFIHGTVAHYPLPGWVWSDAILEEAATLLRRMHDTSTAARFKGAVWQSPSHDPQEVVCHNDFAPYNMVFDNGHLVGIIDFDAASPGPRVWDLAYLAYRLVPFGEDAGPGAPAGGARMSRLTHLIRAYGMSFDPHEVFKVMAVRLEELATYTDGRARDTGDAAFADHAAMYRRDAAHIRRL